ncbi:MAG TPA: DHH family phosphoesterase [Acidobacteriota bacterium]|nr:DHH family phosphoesterase [Acidobacteriota bacterium]
MEKQFEKRSFDRPFERRDNNRSFEHKTFNDYRSARVVDATPIDKPFLSGYNTPFFNKLKPKMLEVASLIRTAINTRRRIFLKHHADCDGFCAGIALERAIIPLIESVNDKKQAAWEKYKRMPSVTPFYNLEDVTKDIAQFLNLAEKFGEDMPLVLLVDLGSGPENILPIKQLQTFGCEVVVIDHHPIDAEVEKLLKYHINPLHFETECAFSAGILCAELSRLIYGEIADEDLLAAISCIGDRVEAPYATDYFNLVAPHGYDEAMLLKIAKSIDFTAHNLRGIEGRELIGILLGDDKAKQIATVELLAAELAVREEKIRLQSENIITTHDTARITYGLFPVSELTLKDMYPRLGNIVGMMNDHLIKTRKFIKPFVMLGTTPNSITFRAQEESKFDFHVILKKVMAEVPLAFVEGGGHPCAGTFRFAESKANDVMVVVKNYLQSL